jgi:hypothetical protein
MLQSQLALFNPTHPPAQIGAVDDYAFALAVFLNDKPKKPLVTRHRLYADDFPPDRLAF